MKINFKLAAAIFCCGNCRLPWLISRAVTLKNDSALPINQIFLTQSRLGTLDFNENEILKITRALNIHKAHGHDDISIRMIQICDRTLLKPLFYFKIQLNICITHICGNGLTLNL